MEVLLKKMRLVFKFSVAATPWLLFGIIIVLGIIFRFSHYTSKPMWGDENQVLIVMQRGYLDIIRTMRYDIHQPLYYIVVKFLSVFSRADAVRKLPSLLSAIATLVVFFPIVRRLTDTKVALVATLLLVCNTEHIRYSQMLRMYTMVTLFSLLSTYYLYRFLETKGDKKAMWLYVITTALAFHTHITSAFVFIFQMLYLAYVGIEGFLINFLNRLKYSLVKNKFNGPYFLLFLISALVLLVGNSVFLKHLSPTGMATSRRYVFISAMLIFSGGSAIASLLSIRFFYKEKPLKPFIDLPLVKKGILMALLLVAVCPIFIYCLSGSFSFYAQRKSPIQSWNPLSLSDLVHNFQFILSGQAPGRVLGFPREILYRAILLPLGILLAFLRGKRWTVLFVLYSLSIYVYIFMVGYSRDSISLGDRHFLLTLPAIIIFVSIGLVWGLETIFTLMVRFVGFLLQLTRLNRLMRFLPSYRHFVAKIAVNILIIVFTAFFFFEDAPAIATDIRWWYEQKLEDWHSFGRFLNANLKPGTLIFFTDQLFEYHVCFNSNARIEDMILHTRNSTKDKRLIWQGVAYNEKITQELIRQGFKDILTIAPGESHLLEKEFKVHTPLLITGNKAGIWEFNVGFSNYDFICYFDSIENLGVRGYGESLFPTVSNEVGSLTYHFKVKDKVRLNSFVVSPHFSVADASYAKVKVSLNGKDFKEVAFIDKNGSCQLDVFPQIKDANSFYIRFELFAKRIPKYLFDAMDAVSLNRIDFKATLR